MDEFVIKRQFDMKNELKCKQTLKVYGHLHISFYIFKPYAMQHACSIISKYLADLVFHRTWTWTWTWA